MTGRKSERKSKQDLFYSLDEKTTDQLMLIKADDLKSLDKQKVEQILRLKTGYLNFIGSVDRVLKNRRFKLLIRWKSIMCKRLSLQRNT